MFRHKTGAPSRAGRRTPSRAGMTLAELLIAMGMSAIGFVIATPPVTKIRSSMMVDAAARQLAGDLHRARIEAIRRNVPISLRKTSEGHYAVDSIGTRILPNNADFSGSPDSVRFASFGPPQSGAVIFVVTTTGSGRKVVSVNASGHVDVR